MPAKSVIARTGPKTCPIILLLLIGWPVVLGQGKKAVLSILRNRIHNEFEEE